MDRLVEPVRVSPFIKFCRWSLLLTGIVYGATKFKALSMKQKAIRDEFERTKPERDRILKIEMDRKAEAEKQMIKEITGN